MHISIIHPQDDSRLFDVLQQTSCQIRIFTIECPNWQTKISSLYSNWGLYQPFLFQIFQNKKIDFFHTFHNLGVTSLLLKLLYPVLFEEYLKVKKVLFDYISFITDCFFIQYCSTTNFYHHLPASSKKSSKLHI